MIYTPDAKEYLRLTSPDISPKSYDERYAGGILLGATVILDNLPSGSITSNLAGSEFGKSLLLAASEGVRYGTQAQLTTPESVHDIAVSDFITYLGANDRLALPITTQLMRSSIVEGHRWQARTSAGLVSPFPLDENGIERAVNFIFGQTEGES